MELIIDHLSKRYGRDFALRELQRVKPPISSGGTLCRGPGCFPGFDPGKEKR